MCNLVIGFMIFATCSKEWEVFSHFKFSCLDGLAQKESWLKWVDECSSDSKAWEHRKQKWHDFLEKPNHLRLRLDIDG
jgi:hypothetical protein